MRADSSQAFDGDGDGFAQLGKQALTVIGQPGDATTRCCWLLAFESPCFIAYVCLPFTTDRD